MVATPDLTEQPRRPAAVVPWRSGLLVVAAGAGLGVVAGLVWRVMAPGVPAIADDPDLAIGSDVMYAVVLLVAGALLGLVASWRLRPHGEVLVAGVLLGGLACSTVAWGVGVAAGAPPLRALALLLAAPIAGLIIVWPSASPTGWATT